MRQKLTPRVLLILAGIVLVAVVLAVAKIVGQPTVGTPTTSHPASDSPVTGGNPSVITGGDPQPADHDDDTDDGTGDDTLLVRPTTEPDAREAATAFTAAWLNTAHRSKQSWYAGIKDRVTPDLAGELALTDPRNVPAGCKTGPVTTTVQGSVISAQAPVVTAEPTPKPVGTLTLTMAEQGRRWLVSEVDWEPRR